MNNDIEYGKNVKPGKTGRQTSRNLEDNNWHGTINVNSRRLSQDQLQTESPSNTGKVQIGTDGIEIVLVQDFRDEDLANISRWAQSSGSGAPEELRAVKDPTEFLQGGLAMQSLEDIVVLFAIRGVSRVCTHQLVRTRHHAAPAEAAEPK